MSERARRLLADNEMRLDSRTVQHLKQPNAKHSSSRTGDTNYEPRRGIHVCVHFATKRHKRLKGKYQLFRDPCAFLWRKKRPDAEHARPDKSIICDYAFTVRYFSTMRVIDSLLVAPTTRSTSLPSRKRIKVGIPLMP